MAWDSSTVQGASQFGSLLAEDWSGAGSDSGWLLPAEDIGLHGHLLTGAVQQMGRVGIRMLTYWRPVGENGMGQPVKLNGWEYLGVSETGAPLLV